MSVTESTMTSKGQVTVPKKVRTALGLRPGDQLSWNARQDGSVEVRKVAARQLEDLVGLLGTPSRSASLEDIDEALRERFRNP